MDEIIENIVMLTLQIAVMVPVTLIFRAVFKKTNKIFSYVMWMVILLRLCIPIQIESPYGMLEFRQNGYPENVYVNQLGEDNKTDSNSPSYIFEGIDESISIVPQNVIVTPQEKTDMVGNAKEKISFRFSLEQILFMVWMAGALVMTIVSVSQSISLKRKISLAFKVEGNVWESDEISTAFVMGIIRPRIYIPVGVVGKEREYILQHERMHIKYGDHIIRLVMLAVNIVYWWNPMVWLAVNFMKKDMEMLCDERVVKKMGTDKKKEYLVTLLKNSGVKSGIIPVMNFAESNTETRIKHIMNLRKPNICCYFLILVFVVFCCLGCVVKQDKIDEDILSEFTTSEIDNGETEDINNSENNITENNSSNEFEEETIYEEWLAMNLPNLGRKMKYPKDDTANRTIMVETYIGADSVGLDLGMLFFVNGIPQSCVDDGGNSSYLSKYYVDAGETVKKDFVCEFNNVCEADKYICRGAMMTSPNVIKTNKHSVGLGFLQDVRECGTTEIKCQNNGSVDVAVLKGKEISKDGDTNVFLRQAFDGDFSASNVLERKTAIGEYMLEFNSQIETTYIISFWGNGEPIQVGDHMYYQIDLKKDSKYQFAFELDEKLVNSIDNFYAIVAPIGYEGEIDKTGTVIFIDEYGK